MARRRARRSKSGDSAMVLVVLVGGGLLALQFVFELLKNTWPVVLGIAVVGVVIWALAKHGKSKTPAVSDEAAAAGAVRSPLRAAAASKTTMSSTTPPSSPVTVTLSMGGEARYTVPPRPAGRRDVTWMPPGATVEVDGRTLVGGMLYVGESLDPPRWRNPAFIDPGMAFAGDGDFRIAEMGYWPSYSNCDPRQRRAYIAWLASGRQHPLADIGYVFLYLYGLEWRSVVDAATDPNAVVELPDIAGEVKRLLEIYGENRSFRGYATRLLEWISLMLLAPETYSASDIEERPRGGTVPMVLRAVIGRHALQGRPLPAALALAWARCDPAVPLRGALRKEPEAFAKAFKRRYAEQYGEGMVIPANRTKLHLEYTGASSALRDRRLTFDFGGVPDVTAVKGPIGKIAKLVEQVNAELQPALKSVAAAKATGDQLGAYLSLPMASWPEELRDRVATLSRRVGDGVRVMKLGEVITELGGQIKGASATLGFVKSLAVRLSESGLGFEPDVQAGGSARKYDVTLVLFAGAPTDPSARQRADYRAAQLMLELASAVAAADGAFGPREMMHLSAQIKTWSHLSEGLRARLRAYLRLLVQQPGSLSGLKKKVAPLSAPQREAIAEFMLAVAHSDGVIEASEIKMLERAYRALGIDADRVFTDLHVTAATAEQGGPVAKELPAKPGSGSESEKGATFTIDKDKVARLQSDTAKVAQLLSTIFADDDPADTQAPEPDDEIEEAAAVDQAPTVLGLDGVHSQFVSLLLQREQWSRADLADVVADLGLMLDGALERVNEAAFDAHDMPLLEGDDPLDVNREIREALEA